MKGTERVFVLPGKGCLAGRAVCLCQPSRSRTNRRLRAMSPVVPIGTIVALAVACFACAAPQEGGRGQVEPSSATPPNESSLQNPKATTPAPSSSAGYMSIDEYSDEALGNAIPDKLGVAVLDQVSMDAVISRVESQGFRVADVRPGHFRVILPESGIQAIRKYFHQLSAVEGVKFVSPIMMGTVDG